MSSRCKWEIKDKAIVSNSNFFRFFFSTCGTGVRGTCVHDMCTGTLLLQVLLPGMVFLVFQIFSLRYCGSTLYVVHVMYTGTTSKSKETTKVICSSKVKIVVSIFLYMYCYNYWILNEMKVNENQNENHSASVTVVLHVLPG